MSRVGIPFQPTDGLRIPPRVRVHGVTGGPEVIDAAVDPYKRAVFQIYAGYRLQRSQSIIEMDQYRARLDPNAWMSISTVQGMDIINLYINQVETEEDAIEIYLESGALSFTFPGESNPTRFEPAEWKFVASETGIVGDDDALGLYAGKDTYEDGQDSIAIGKTESNATVTKKLICALFPASLFSGLMRLFVQSQYGADNENEFPFAVELVGTEMVLRFHTIQMTYYTHNTVGILKRGEYDYLFTVISAPDTEHFTVTGYAITASEEAVAVAKELDEQGFQNKALAYLFAYATIDEDEPIDIGSFSVSEPGGSMAYGWKFNNRGNSASIVIHQAFGTPKYFKSYRVDLDFTYYETGVFFNKSETTHSVWIDVPAHKMFVPAGGSYTSGTCDIFSLAMPYLTSRDLNRYMDFSNVPLYCWYDSTDTLQTLTISHVNSTASETTFEYSGIVPVNDPPVNYSDLQNGWAFINESRMISRFIQSSGQTTTFSVGGITEIGTSYRGDLLRVSYTPPQGGSSAGTQTFYPDTIGTYASPYNAPSTDVLDAIQTDYGLPVTITVDMIVGDGVQTQISGNVIDSQAICIHIPAGDCEAVYIATDRYIEPDGATTTVTTRTNEIAYFSVSMVDTGSGDPVCTDVIHISWADATDNTYLAYTDSTETPETQPIGFETLGMKTFTKTLSGVTTNYVGSGSAYFGWRLDRLFDPASKTIYESYGGAHVGSDIEPYGLTTLPGTWVGWA